MTHIIAWSCLRQDIEYNIKKLRDIKYNIKKLRDKK